MELQNEFTSRDENIQSIMELSKNSPEEIREIILYEALIRIQSDLTLAAFTEELFEGAIL